MLIERSATVRPSMPTAEVWGAPQDGNLRYHIMPDLMRNVLRSRWLAVLKKIPVRQ